MAELRGGWPSPANLVGNALWHSCVIGDFAFPSDASLGSCEVEIKSSQKLDEKKAAGKDKARMTQKGRDPCPVAVSLEFDASIWPDTEAALLTIDPNSIATGGPFVFSHPDAERRGVKYIMIKEIGPVKFQGRKGTVKIEAVEWEEPKPIIKGSKGASTSSGNAGGLSLAILTQNRQDVQRQIDELDQLAAQGEAINQTQRERLLKQLEQIDQNIQALNESNSKTPTTPVPNAASTNPAATNTPSAPPKADPYSGQGAPDAEP